MLNKPMVIMWIPKMLECHSLNNTEVDNNWPKHRFPLAIPWWTWAIMDENQVSRTSGSALSKALQCGQTVGVVVDNHITIWITLAGPYWNLVPPPNLT